MRELHDLITCIFHMNGKMLIKCETSEKVVLGKSKKKCVGETGIVIY